ncbi:MAG: 50S ribosomal protein L15 [Candidatus Nealsonbacteria bacterium]
MQLQEIKPKYNRHSRKRVGRGGKRGTYCGRGRKGQKARESRNMVPSIRGLIKRYPKLRGYRFKSIKREIAVVNIEALEKKFKAGDIVSPETLLQQGLIRRIKGQLPSVKILAKGKLVKNLIVENCQLSAQARVLIGKAGGTIKEYAVAK